MAAELPSPLVLGVFDRLPPAARAVIARLEDDRRHAWASRHDNGCERAIHAADRVAESHIGEDALPTTDTVRALMALCYEEEA